MLANAGGHIGRSVACVIIMIVTKRHLLFFFVQNTLTFSFRTLGARSMHLRTSSESKIEWQPLTIVHPGVRKKNQARWFKCYCRSSGGCSSDAHKQKAAIMVLIAPPRSPEVTLRPCILVYPVYHKKSNYKHFNCRKFALGALWWAVRSHMCTQLVHIRKAG